MGALHFKHVLGVLRRTTVDRKRVLLGIYGPPLGHVRLVGCFDLPVLDEVLDQRLEGTGPVVRPLLCRELVSASNTTKDDPAGGIVPSAHICLVRV